MRRAVSILIMVFSVLAAFVPLVMAFGPVAPTNAIISKTKPVNKAIPDLPYKPQEPGGDPGTFPSDNDVNANKPPEEKIDWSKIPFVPSKKLELAPAPDPEIE